MVSPARNQLTREEGQKAKADQDVASLSRKITAKERELSRAKTPLRQRTIEKSLADLKAKRTKAESTAAAHGTKISKLRPKVAKEEAAAAAKASEAAAKRDQASSRRLSEAESAVSELDARLTEVEGSLLDRVRHEVEDDPVVREHDVFLSHTSDPDDVATAESLYQELTARGLDVWFDGAELRLGESIARQIDRGIAKSKVGLVLITPAFLKGRMWTDKELGALISVGRRVIPVVDGTTIAELAEYSPLLADSAGLTTDSKSHAEIAEAVVVAVSPP